MNVVHLCDCMSFMKHLPDNHYDLAIVDPPYGIGADAMNMGTNENRSGKNSIGETCYPGTSTATRLRKNRLNSGSGKLKGRILNNSNTSWDVAPDKAYFDELMRVSKNQIIWGGNYFDLPPTRGVVCWDKKQPWANFSQFELAWTSFDVPAQIFRFSNTGGGNTEKKIHPTQKPIELYKWILQKYGKGSKKIFDSHVGSGSSRIACFEMGFDFEGCEIDSVYWEAQEARFKNYSIQESLFLPEEFQNQMVSGSLF